MRTSLQAVGFGVLLIVASCAAPGPTPTPTCQSPVLERGPTWREIGGPHVWLLFEPPYVAVPRYPRRLWIRLDGTSSAGLRLEARHPGGSTVEGFVQSQPIVDWGPGAGPPDGLDGSVFFAGVTLDTPGCWEITIRTNREVVGSGRVEVVALPSEPPPT
jgi:hypothetical protein